ncbi:MAG: DUF2461 domain-containing protein [Clostridiales bacterium]|nr:DUF2461 domain-containing protein [Clostridiales bacterium]
MFDGFPKEMLEFMLKIRFNNNKEFMSSHRDEYEIKMRNPHYQLIEALTPLMLQIDQGMEVRPNKVLSRIFRDTRFSKNKSPYRSHHWLAFRHTGEPRESAVVFWFEITLERLSWGLGFWGQNKPAMEIFRKRLLSHPDDWETLIRTLNNTGLAVEGESYKRLNSPAQLKPSLTSYYKLKNIYLVRRDAHYNDAFTPKLFENIAKDFRVLAPFYQMMRGYHEITLQ